MAIGSANNKKEEVTWQDLAIYYKCIAHSRCWSWWKCLQQTGLKEDIPAYPLGYFEQTLVPLSGFWER